MACFHIFRIVILNFVLFELLSEILSGLRNGLLNVRVSGRLDPAHFLAVSHYLSIFTPLT